MDNVLVTSEGTKVLKLQSMTDYRKDKEFILEKVCKNCLQPFFAKKPKQEYFLENAKLRTIDSR